MCRNMTLGPAVAAFAHQAAKQFPNDLAAAAKCLLSQCKTAGIAPPRNPGAYIKYWQGRVTPRGDIRSHAQRSGRKPKLTDAKVQSAYKAILSWEKAGRERPYESASDVATSCPQVKKLLAKTGAKINTLIARIKQKHPRFGRHKLKAKWHMTAQVQKERLDIAQDLLANYADKLDWVVHLDAKTVYLQEQSIYGYVDLAVGYTVSHIPSATKQGKVIKLRYYAAVNAQLGAFFMMFYTGTTDMPANRRGAHYKVGSGVKQLGLVTRTHIHQCLSEQGSPLLKRAAEAGVTLIHPQPQHSPALLDCCLSIPIVPELPCADAVICVVGLGHRPAAVALSHHFNQQTVRCDCGKVPPLSAGVYHSAIRQPHTLLLAQAACFHSIQLKQLLCICHII